ncbi:hypothetical protein [Subtercola frigoramans]|uniref:Uncharacterized protein n=1 Tax=Subtercola frigoramans TaxID=120298 RepID=A0ABS2L1F7_9MICO|nr:hypothetical protein [Subtercola frigoramans]MBM7470918.1 hypothetical protein [Subtercola frigoramans]
MQTTLLIVDAMAVALTVTYLIVGKRLKKSARPAWNLLWAATLSSAIAVVVVAVANFFVINH